jgi:hypothetical protein
MKLTNQMQDGTSSFSRLRSLTELPTGSVKASSGKLYSSSSNPATRSDGVWECWSNEIEKPVFCGLSLELSARPVMSNETVLPKAAVTAGKIILRLNLGVASAALRDARQRYLWKGEW